MAFTKSLKTRQYFKRYQTKFRRRREAKTDYYARKRMVMQDVNKYGAPKYRLVVRFSNQRVITQIAYSTIKGDMVLCQATSHELTRFGLTAGLKSYSASYATGLLLARRLLKQIGLDQVYAGAEEVTGNNYDVAAIAETYTNDRRPFKAILDIGLTNSSIGNRVYAVLKGACDGGLNIPHGTKNFYGSEQDEETKKWSYYPEANRDRIFGCHIDTYMTQLKEEGEEAYQKQFSLWDKCLKSNNVDTVEALFEKIFAEIRKSPVAPAKKTKDSTPQTYEDEEKSVIKTKNGSYKRHRKLTLEERKANLQKKINDAVARAQAAME